jgi:hypothetical protein
MFEYTFFYNLYKGAILTPLLLLLLVPPLLSFYKKIEEVIVVSSSVFFLLFFFLFFFLLFSSSSSSFLSFCFVVILSRRRSARRGYNKYMNDNQSRNYVFFLFLFYFFSVYINVSFNTDVRSPLGRSCIRAWSDGVLWGIPWGGEAAFFSRWALPVFFAVCCCVRFWCPGLCGQKLQEAIVLVEIFAV